MRTPTDERTGYRVAVWAGALLLMVPVGLAGVVVASATFVEATSESVSADFQLADAGPAVVAVPLLLSVALGGLLGRWGAGWRELAAVVPLVVLLPYLLVAAYVAWLWSPTGLGLTDEGDPSWTRLLVTACAHLLVLGVAALLLGLLAGRLGAGPVALTLLVLVPAVALAFVPPAYLGLGDLAWDGPVWFSLRVLLSGEDELMTYGGCPLVATGICGGTVGPLRAGVQLLALLAVLATAAVAASAATRSLRSPRRRLSR